MSVSQGNFSKKTKSSECFLAMEKLVFRLQKEFRQKVESVEQTINKKIPSKDGLKFKTTHWKHKDRGGGRSLTLSGGVVFEKAGLNVSSIESQLTSEMAERLKTKPSSFRVCGISLIFHPRSPMIPTIHMNVRYFETETDSWFGGGTDLTPYYPFEEDFIHFHRVTKDATKKIYPKHYKAFKEKCDDYFYLKHRKEMRGIGGVFFDYLRDGKNKEDEFNHTNNFKLVESLGEAFLASYFPIVEKRQMMRYGEAEKSFQQLRRGRYVEFNLLYDRGTHFGLKTGGRVDSILVSLPPVVEFPVPMKFKPGSFQAKMNRYYQPKQWVK